MCVQETSRPGESYGVGEGVGVEVGSIVAGAVGPGGVDVAVSVGPSSVGVGDGDGEGEGLGDGSGVGVGVAVASGSLVGVGDSGAVVGVGVGLAPPPLSSWFARKTAAAAPTPIAMRMIPMTTRRVAPLTPPESWGTAALLRTRAVGCRRRSCGGLPGGAATGAGTG